MVLETPRTLLRYFKQGDAADLYGYLSLPETYEYEPGCPVTPERAVDIARERQGGKEFVAVVDKDSDKLSGHFSFFPSGPDTIRTFELGYIFNPRFQGKGLVTEAGRRFLEYCFSDLNVHRVVANCNPDNGRSWRLLERLGFEREGCLKKNVFFKEVNGMPVWQDTYLYGLVNPRE